MWITAATMGALTGLGAWVVVRAVVPAPPDAQRAIARLTNTHPPSQSSSVDTSRGGIYSRVGVHALTSLRGRQAPLLVRPSDLDLVGVSPQLLLGQKIICALLGLLLGPSLGFLFTLAGMNMPVALTPLMSLLIAAGFWFLPDLEVRSKANRAREEMREVAVTYLELLAITRSAGALSSQAMNDAASISEHWAFKRIDSALKRATLTGQSPWDAVVALGQRIEVDELAEVGDIMRLAGESGGQVGDSLRATAASKRDTSLAAEEAHAQRREQMMQIPTTMMVFGFVILILVPSLAAL